MIGEEGFFNFMAGDYVNECIFNKYDEDENGILDLQEIRVLLVEEYTLTEDQINVQIVLLDKDGNKDISLEEFNNWINDNVLQDVKDSTRFGILKKTVELFKEADANGNGTLDHEEFNTFYANNKFPETDRESSIKELDPDNKKVIVFDTFMNWLKYKPMGWFDTKEEEKPVEEPVDDFFGFFIGGDAINQAIYDKFDKDSNGVLDMKEIRILLEEEYGLNPEQLDVQSLLLDKDGSNDISFDEFNNWINGSDILQDVKDDTRFGILAKTVKQFKKADSNGNGSLDYKEFNTFYADNKFPESEREAAIKEMDPDNKKIVAFEAFMDWLKMKPMGWFLDQ